MPDIRFAYNGKLVSPSSAKVIGDRALPPIAQKTLRFKFYDKTIDPTQWANVWGINASWTRIKQGIYDWHCDHTEWSARYSGSGASSGGNSALATYRWNRNGSWVNYLTNVDLDIIDSDLTGVTNVYQLFNTANGVHHCSLKNTGSVQNWCQCFYNNNRGVKLESLDPLDMSSVDVTKFNNSSNAMFSTARNINSPIVLNLPNATSLQYLFTGQYNISSSTLTLNLSSAFMGATAPVLGTGTFEEVIITGTTGMTSASYFNGSYVKKYTWTDWNTSGVDCSAMFGSCTRLTGGISLPANAKVTNATSMFTSCNITTAPSLDLSSCADTSYMFNGCTLLASVPSYVLPAATNTSNMFNGCTAVESGALAMYNYLSTKTVAVTTYNNTFTNCGSNTVTGAAELAQIPTSWGGTMSSGFTVNSVGSNLYDAWDGNYCFKSQRITVPAGVSLSATASFVWDNTDHSNYHGSPDAVGHTAYLVLANPSDSTKYVVGTVQQGVWDEWDEWSSYINLPLTWSGTLSSMFTWGNLTMNDLRDSSGNVDIYVCCTGISGGDAPNGGFNTIFEYSGDISDEGSVITVTVS